MLSTKKSRPVDTGFFAGKVLDSTQRFRNAWPFRRRATSFTGHKALSCKELPAEINFVEPMFLVENAPERNRR